MDSPFKNFIAFASRRIPYVIRILHECKSIFILAIRENAFYETQNLIVINLAFHHKISTSPPLTYIILNMKLERMRIVSSGVRIITITF